MSYQVNVSEYYILFAFTSSSVAGPAALELHELNKRADHAQKRFNAFVKITKQIC